MNVGLSALYSFISLTGEHTFGSVTARVSDTYVQVHDLKTGDLLTKLDVGVEHVSRTVNPIVEQFMSIYRPFPSKYLDALMAIVVLSTVEKNNEVQLGDDIISVFRCSVSKVAWLCINKNIRVCVIPGQEYVLAMDGGFEETLERVKNCSAIKSTLLLGNCCGYIVDGIKLGLDTVIQASSDNTKLLFQNSDVESIGASIYGLAKLAIYDYAICSELNCKTLITDDDSIRNDAVELAHNVLTLKNGMYAMDNTCYLSTSTVYVILRNKGDVKSFYIDLTTGVTVLCNMSPSDLYNMANVSAIKVRRLSDNDTTLSARFDRYLQNNKPESITDEFLRVIGLYDKDVKESVEKALESFMADCAK